MVRFCRFVTVLMVIWSVCSCAGPETHAARARIETPRRRAHVCFSPITILMCVCTRIAVVDAV